MKHIVLTALLAIPLLPPAEFNHPYPGPYEVYFVDRSNVWAECGRQHHRTVAGCQWFDGPKCIVVVALRSPRAKPEDIVLHERAHCNGWRH